MASRARLQDYQPDDIRAELCARIDQLERDFRLLSVGELCRRTDIVRQIARANRLEPVSQLAAGLGHALAHDGRGAAVRPFIDNLRDALACEAQDEATARAFLAAVNVRLAG